MAKVEIKLVRSAAHRKPNQQKTAKALGLTKLNRTVIKEDNESIRGMINTISHLVEVKEVK